LATQNVLAENAALRAELAAKEKGRAVDAKPKGAGRRSRRRRTES
jgi:hypothetical protein